MYSKQQLLTDNSRTGLHTFALRVARSSRAPESRTALVHDGPFDTLRQLRGCSVPTMIKAQALLWVYLELASEASSGPSLVKLLPPLRKLVVMA
jgi:hypothetical protein